MAKTVLKKNAEFLRIPGINDILPSVALFLAGRAELLGTFPFGLAMFCACFDKSTAYLGITVMYLGLLSSGAGGAAVQYMLGALIFWLFAKLYTKAGRSISALVCGTGLLVSGMAMSLYGDASLHDFLILVAESAVTAVMYIVFSNTGLLLARSRMAPTQEELISLAIAAAVIITGTSGVSLPYEITPSHILSVLVILTVSKNTSVSASAAMGLCIGFITGTANNNAIVMTGILGICSVFANMLKDFGKIGTVVGFIGGAAVSLLCIPATYMFSLSVADVVIACVIFIAIPKKFHNRLGDFFKAAISDEINSDRAKGYIIMKLEECANAFSSLKDVFIDGSDKRGERYEEMVTDMFDKVACRVCKTCGRAGRCWDMDFEKTCKGMVSLLGVIESEGFLSAENAPLPFRDRCVRSSEFVMEFNHVYELEKAEIMRLGDAKRTRDLAAVQYGEISRIFKGFARDVEEGFEFCTDMEEKIISGLGMAGIIAFEVNVAQSGSGKFEIFMRLGQGYDIIIAQKIVGEVIGYEVNVLRENDREVVMVSKPRFYLETGMAKRSVKTENGDSFAAFNDSDHKFWAIISDGMGNGKEAMEESLICVRLLKEFLLSGFSPATAINMLNSSLCLKLERESFATVDLLQLDLMTGMAQFYKIGAASTVMYRNGEAQSIYSMSPPVGMVEDIETVAQTKRIEDGDVILMVSDGVTDAPLVHTEWIKNRIKADCQDMDKLAENIINTAIEKGGGEIRDDMSVIAIKVVEC